MKFLVYVFLFAFASVTGLANYQIKDKDFLFEKDKKALTTSIYLVLNTGSINDPASFPGLTNATFNAILRGSESLKRDQLALAIEKLGADISVDVNFNYTTIGLTTINENLEPAIQLFADTVLNPKFRGYEIKPLLNEIVAKLEQLRSNNRHLLFRTLRRQLFTNTPIQFPTSGYPLAVQSISFNQIRQQYKKHMRSENVFFAATSSVPEEKIKEMLNKAFVKMPLGAAPEQPKVVLNQKNGRRFFVIPREGVETTEFAVAQIGFNASYEDRVILETAMFSFGNDFSSRAMTELRKNKGWTYGAYARYSFLDLPRKYGGAFAFYSFPQKKYTEQAILKSVELLEDYAKNGLTEEELNYAKQSLKNSYPFKLVQADARLSQRIYQRIDGAPFYTVEEYRRLVDRITLADVRRAVAKLHDPQSMIFVAVGDPQELRKVAARIHGVQKITVIRDPMRR